MDVLQVKGVARELDLGVLGALDQVRVLGACSFRRVRSLSVVVVFLVFVSIVVIFSVFSRSGGGVDIRTISQTRSDETFGRDILNVWLIFCGFLKN